ncbi:substrate-binding domain-containing protein, partial [Paenibacillus sp. TAF58]
LQAVRQVAERHQPLVYTQIQGDFNKSAGETAAKRIIQEYTEPVAVFCLNDEMAIGLYNAVRESEYRIGTHIHIIGFDNIELTEYTEPRLATIDYSKRKWGALASEQLLKLIADEEIDHERIYVTLVKGDSVHVV